MTKCTKSAKMWGIALKTICLHIHGFQIHQFKRGDQICYKMMVLNYSDTSNIYLHRTCTGWPTLKARSILNLFWSHTKNNWLLATGVRLQLALSATLTQQPNNKLNDSVSLHNHDPTRVAGANMCVNLNNLALWRQCPSNPAAKSHPPQTYVTSCSAPVERLTFQAVTLRSPAPL